MFGQGRMMKYTDKEVQCRHIALGVWPIRESMNLRCLILKAQGTVLKMFELYMIVVSVGKQHFNHINYYVYCSLWLYDMFITC